MQKLLTLLVISLFLLQPLSVYSQGRSWYVTDNINIYASESYDRISVFQLATPGTYEIAIDCSMDRAVLGLEVFFIIVKDGFQTPYSCRNLDWGGVGDVPWSVVVTAQLGIELFIDLAPGVLYQVWYEALIREISPPPTPEPPPAGCFVHTLVDRAIPQPYTFEQTATVYNWNGRVMWNRSGPGSNDWVELRDYPAVDGDVIQAGYTEEFAPKASSPGADLLVCPLVATPTMPPTATAVATALTLPCGSDGRVVSTDWEFVAAPIWTGGAGQKSVYWMVTLRLILLTRIPV
jgi:hypothetical protein